MKNTNFLYKIFILFPSIPQLHSVPKNMLRKRKKIQYSTPSWLKHHMLQTSTTSNRPRTYTKFTITANRRLSPRFCYRWHTQSDKSENPLNFPQLIKRKQPAECVCNEFIPTVVTTTTICVTTKMRCISPQFSGVFTHDTSKTRRTETNRQLETKKRWWQQR